MVTPGFGGMGADSLVIVGGACVTGSRTADEQSGRAGAPARAHGRMPGRRRRLPLCCAIVRNAFHGELAQLGTALSDMAAFSAEAMRQATTALLTADLHLAEQILSRDSELDALRTEAEEHAQALLALQAPVAQDLRIVLAAVYCAERIERMGDLAAHVAGAVRVVHPGRVVPDELEESFSELGRITTGMAGRVGELITAPVEGAFAELEQADEAADELHAQILRRITSADWPHGAATASSLALVARFYERFGDQAVTVAKRLDFAATGTLPES